jgi:hypothetical protein
MRLCDDLTIFDLQMDSLILYKFKVKKRQEPTKQERQGVVCITYDYFIEKWVDHVIALQRIREEGPAACF